MNKKKILIYELIISIIVSLFIFILLYGVKPLNVTDDSWIFLRGGDLVQHYTGWEFYRNSSWGWPIGAIDGLAYPDRVSLIFVDCIPWMAVLFKLLSPVLPSTFQYMGIYALLCFILQMFVGMKIAELFSDKIYCIVPAGMLLGVSAGMIYRVFYHTALASHYLILIAVYLWISASKSDYKKQLVSWLLLGMLIAATHLYIVPIAGIILLGMLLTEALKDKKYLLKGISLVIAYIIGAVFVFALFGGFGGDFDQVPYRDSNYNINLNSFFNSENWGIVLPRLPYASSGQYEGYSYLGYGWILIVFLAVITLYLHFSEINKKMLLNYGISFAVISVITVLAASGSFLSFGKNVLFNIEYPVFIKELLAIFRSHGRFVWAAAYILPVFSMYIIMRLWKNKRAVAVIMSLLFVVQIVDLSGFWNNYRRWNAVVNEIQDTQLWDRVTEGIEHIVYLPAGNDFSQQNRLYSLAHYANSRGITLDDFYFARSRIMSMSEKHNEFRDKLDAHEIMPGTMIVFDDVFEAMDRNWELYCYNIDNYILGFSEPLVGFEPIDFAKGIDVQVSKKSCYRNAVSDETGAVIIDKDSTFTGPEWNLGAGHYQVVFKGENLSGMKLKYDSNVNRGQLREPQEISVNDKEAVYEFDVDGMYYGSMIMPVCAEGEIRQIKAMSVIKK